MSDTKAPTPVVPYQAHPWHGISVGDCAPDIVASFIEMVPTDTVKYEVDKRSGHLKLDRPQKFSSQCPAPYGFIPQTYCGERCGQYAGDKTGRTGIIGDGDPLDICVLSERTINHGGVLVNARPIGGYRMFDGNEADDKILAVLCDDPAYGAFRTIADCPRSLVERLRHYFLTYKDMPGQNGHGQTPRRVEITDIYDADEARHIIALSQADYQASFRPTW
ncbi:MAG: inorganic pyrophosphatase [Myxococcales bacterium]|nr:inorganic pyrophosphatase [Myxococcales bacterium]